MFSNRLMTKESEEKRKLARKNAARKRRTGLGYKKHTPGPKGARNDCAVRAATLATGLSYKYVYDELQTMNTRAKASRSEIAKYGTLNDVTTRFLWENGWEKIETGWKEKKLLKAEYLPVQPCVVQVSGHLLFVDDDTVLDTWDSRGDRSRRIEAVYVPEYKVKDCFKG